MNFNGIPCFSLVFQGLPASLPGVIMENLHQVLRFLFNETADLGVYFRSCNSQFLKMVLVRINIFLCYPGIKPEKI
jgi:hypothetical protein